VITLGVVSLRLNSLLETVALKIGGKHVEEEDNSDQGDKKKQ